MILPESRAKEVLDLCLRDESAEMKTKVYEILSLSEIKANDPMFLVLALTGQLRIFFETAPAELNQLLDRWKSQSCKSMTELLDVVKQLERSQKEYKDSIHQSVEEINSKGLSNIEAINKSLVAEILSTNGEIELGTKKLVEDLDRLYEQVSSDRKETIKIMESLIEGIAKTYNDLDQINAEIKSSISKLKEVKSSRSQIWLTYAILLVAVLCGSIGFTILTTRKPQESSLIDINDKSHLFFVENIEAC